MASITSLGFDSIGTWLVSTSEVCGTHSLCHETLQVGLDGAVLRRHDVPARLRPPGGAFNFLVEQVRGWRKVRRPDNFLL
jgi:hypothetical protein